MARVGLVKTINLHSLEQALIKGVMSNILVLMAPSVTDFQADSATRGFTEPGRRF